MARRIRIYDIPDGFPSVKQWLDELSNEDFLAHILMVERVGPAFAGCTLLPDRMWALKVSIGYGKTANLILMPLKNGDFLAIHGFTLKRNEKAEDQLAIAMERQRDLL